VPAALLRKMRVIFALVPFVAAEAAAPAPAECGSILSSAELWSLSQRTYDLYYDMGAVVAAGLYKEVKTRAGPEVMKQIQAKVDLGLLMYNEYYTKAMTAAAPVLPVLKQAKTQATELYSKAVAAATPKLAQLNAYIQRAMVQFASAMPQHAELLTADSLLDKVVLFVWLVAALTVGLRLVGYAFAIVSAIVFFPCRLLCGRRAAKVEKKTFAGKSQAANGNAKNPTAPKKKA
jgi:hypothetical protein